MGNFKLFFKRWKEQKKSLSYFNKLEMRNLQFSLQRFLETKMKRNDEKKIYKNVSKPVWPMKEMKLVFCIASVSQYAVCDIHAFDINWIYLSPFISDHCFCAPSGWCSKRNYKWLNAYWPQIVSWEVVSFYRTAWSAEKYLFLEWSWSYCIWCLKLGD